MYGAALGLALIFAGAACFYPEKRLFQAAGRRVILHERRILAFLAFLPLFLVSALRNQVGGDYIGYERIFRNVSEGVDIYAEPGFWLLNRLVLVYSDNIQWVYAISAAVTLALLFWGIFRDSPNPVLSLFLLAAMGYFFSSFNILRQFIAAAILFAGFRLLLARKFLPYLALVLLAMTFHKTAVVMLPFYFLLNLRLKQSYQIALAVCGLCLFPFRERLTALLVNVFYPQYANTNLIQPLSLLECVYYLAVFGGLVLLSNLYRERFFTSRTNTFLYNAMYYTFLMYLCLSFVPEINRVALYTELLVLLHIPRLLLAEEDRRVCRLYTAVLVFGFTGYCVISLAVLGRWNVLPYVSIFS